MSYGLIYQTEYDALKTGEIQRYTDKIYKKNYSGVISNVLAAGQPAKHQWQTDDPKAPIKGSNFTLTLINQGSLPLSSFFSVEDDTFLIEHYWESQLLFTGYLVQSDCTEIQTDITHEIVLSFTDNLGLLKDVAFDKANLIVGDGNRTLTGVLALAPGGGGIDQYFRIDTPSTGAIIGDTMLVEGTSGSDGIYIIVNIVLAGTYTAIYVDRPVPFPVAFASTYTFTFITPADLSDKLPLAYFLRVCLYSTNLPLSVDVYSNIIETVSSTPMFLEETFELGNDYSTGNNTWKSCYDVLNIIFDRFNATFFQAEGVWNLLRWDEARYYNNAITGFRYTSDMVYDSDITLNNIFTTGYNQITFPEFGLTKSILRPYKFDKETLNYKQPANLLCNFNFQDTGALLNDYADGSNHVYEYFMPCWNDGPFAPYPSRYIRVTKDSLGNEILRYAVLTGATGSNVLSAVSEPVDVEVGDTVKVSFSWRTKNSHTSVNNAFAVRLYDGTTTRYIQADGSWGTPIGINFPFSDSGVWNNVDIPTCLAIPYRGQIQVFLNDATYTAGEENWYKDLFFEYKPAVNDLLNIIGHTHTDAQQPTIKNTEDVEIFIDDSPRNSIQGTLFLSTFTGLLQDRTTLWGYAPGGTRRLGNITTFEQLFWRRKPRVKLEGTMRKLVQNGTPVPYMGTVDFYMLSTPSTYYGIHAPLIPSGVINVGDTIVVTGTTSNNGTFTVISIWSSGSLFPIGTYMVQEVIVTEPGVSCTLTVTPKRHLSMLTLCLYTGEPDKNFIWGMMNIDYKANTVTGTLWELWETGEVDADLLDFYEFKYLYETK